MIYTSLQDLALAAESIDLTNTKQLEEWRRLVRIYMDAENNPPEGVIGVGLITYAQEKLIAAQIDGES